MDEREFTIRERVAGYHELNRLELEARRKQTFEDRFQALSAILRQCTFAHSVDPTEEVVRERWIRIKDEYERRET